MPHAKTTVRDAVVDVIRSGSTPLTRIESGSVDPAGDDDLPFANVVTNMQREDSIDRLGGIGFIVIVTITVQVKKTVNRDADDLLDDIQLAITSLLENDGNYKLGVNELDSYFNADVEPELEGEGELPTGTLVLTYHVLIRLAPGDHSTIIK